MRERKWGFSMGLNDTLRSFSYYIRNTDKVLYDYLTNIYSRGFILELLSKEFYRAKRYGRPLCVLMMDLDNFKRVNDKYGHVAGDKVLIDVSSKIKKSLRDADYVGRYGGEELLVILPETTLENAAKVGERLRSLVEKKIIKFGNEKVSMTISIGVSDVKKEDEVIQNVIGRADSAMYKAKKAGKNQVVIYQG